MSAYNRYSFTKEVYPDYLVLDELDIMSFKEQKVSLVFIPKWDHRCAVLQD